MSDRAIDVPAVVRRRAERLGEPGRAWLAGLPALLVELAREWSITLGETLDGGTASHVCRVRTADGRAAVLKVVVPDPDFASQVRTIRAARGNGYVALLDHDAERGAVLLEALGPSLYRQGASPEPVIAVLCQTLRRAWGVPRPPGATVAPGRDKASLLADLVVRLWHAHDRPCSARVVDRALEFADRRAREFDLDRCVVVHGDPHPGNALRMVAARPGAESGYVFVDPDGFLAEPAYDLGVVLRDWCAQLLAGDAVATARRYCSLLAAGSGIGYDAIWQWGFLERVSTGLYVLDLGLHAASRDFLNTAELLAAE